jgi:large-conductance mechanosensitive channel
MSIDQSVIQTTEPIRKFQQNFKHFTTNIIIVLIACAVCIGFATKDMISSIMNESILPIISYFAVKSIPYFLYNKALQISKYNEIITLIIHKLGLSLWIIIVWILTLYLTFIVFKLITRVDVLTDKVNLIQDISKYVLGEKTNSEYIISENKQS